MASNQTHTPSQRYLSTRGGDYGLSFEAVVMKGLAQDGGLFLPEEIPSAPDWQSWKDLSYAELAFKILSLYISPTEIPPADLKDIVDRSYSTFRAPEVVPLVHLHDDLYLLELFHGPSYSFKDCAMQFLGNLFEYFLLRRNQGKEGKDRYHLTVVGATSGDTGSAAIYGLRGKKDVSVFILYPRGRISPTQENQMTSVLEDNVHTLAVEGTFDDCQDILKVLFADEEANEKLRLGAVNSINFARIVAQIVYYFQAYFQLAKQSPTFQIGDKVRLVTPTGNFGNILAGYFATKMGLPVEKLVVATNENDILDRFWKTGRYEKKPAASGETQGGGCKATLSPAMDVLVSSNFERLMWFLAKDLASASGSDDEASKKKAGEEVAAWFQALKTAGGFGPVPETLLESGRATFESGAVTDEETLATIKAHYRPSSGKGYLLDPHSAVGVTVAERSLAARKSGSMATPHISLSTAHPGKFPETVVQALGEEDARSEEARERVFPAALVDLGKLEKRVTEVDNSWEKVRELVQERVLARKY